MKKFPFFLAVVSFMLSSTRIAEGRLRVKRSEKSSKYIYRVHEEDETTTVASELDICKIEDEKDSDSKRTRRDILSPFPTIATTAEDPDEEVDISILSPEFKNCSSHVPIEPECYKNFHNGSVFVPLYNMYFDRSNYVIRKRLLLICPDFYKNFTANDKFSSSIETVSIVCVIISAVCIFLHVIMFILVKRLRNLPGYILLSLCIALESAYTCSFVQFFITEHFECTVIGMFLLYFFLASFFWMNAMSYDVWRSIRLATAKLRLTTDRPIMIRFARYSIYAWGIPLLIIISSIIVHYTSSNIKYRLIFSRNTCWFEYKQALTMYFAIPLFSILGMNILFFASSFYMISQASMSNAKSGSNRSELLSRLFLSLRLSSVMGFMWISGIIALATEKEWLWYVYAVSNALQGLFIFFSFTVSERTRKAFRKVVQGKKFSISPTQTSSQHATTV